MAAATAVLAVICGCGHGAFIELKGDTFVEGTITHSDARHLYVDQEEGGPVSLNRDQITDIDHPGTVLQIAGALVALVGFSSLADTDNSSLAVNTIVFSVFAGPGLAMLGWGTWANLRSRKAARNLTREKERIVNERPYLPAPPHTIPLFPPSGLQKAAPK